MEKSECLSNLKSVNGTLAVTFNTPHFARSDLEEMSCLSCKDTDFFEMNVLRQFFINMNRVVPFRFVAYPEDRARDSETSFKRLHYHGVISSDNDAKFQAVAPRKYTQILKNVYSKFFHKIKMPATPIWIDLLDRNDPEKCYESYILKHYYPSKHLVSHNDFLLKSFTR